jgi:hypothetical protein
MIDEPAFIALGSRLETAHLEAGVFLREGKESENYNAATHKRIQFGYKEKIMSKGTPKLQNAVYIVLTP